MMIVAYAAALVAVVTFVLYALDRRAKGEPIDMMTALKLTLFGGLTSGGVAYATTTGESVLETVNAIVPEIPAIQEMFIGEPVF
jgi:hypothetical protein